MALLLHQLRQASLKFDGGLYVVEIVFLGALFVGSHFVLSAPSIRRRAIDRLGERGFAGFYSLVALLSLGAFIMGYNNQLVLSFNYWWGPAPQYYWVAKFLMWAAFVLAVGAFMAPNPSLLGMAGGMGSSDSQAVSPQGVQVITRHPFLWAVALWAVAHMTANGDSISVLFFGWFLLLGVFGAWILDWKKTQQLGDVWSLYCEQTSNTPFVALLRGRVTAKPRDLLLPAIVGSIVYAIVFWGHGYLAGVNLF